MADTNRPDTNSPEARSSGADSEDWADHFDGREAVNGDDGAHGSGTPPVLRGISDIRRYFFRNKTPTYFISATNFNLLGMDEWVRNFHFINYIDCFDGEHPHVFVPSEKPHQEFTCIEDINNYLLEHKEVVDFLEARGGAGRPSSSSSTRRRSSSARSWGWRSAFHRLNCAARWMTRSRPPGSRIGPAYPPCPMS